MAAENTVVANAESWGGVSRWFTIIGGIIAIFGGLSLVGLKAAGANSMIESIANGMGWYFIGKGLFMMATPFQVRGAIDRLLSR
jgi:hypothetical protein